MMQALARRRGGLQAVEAPPAAAAPARRRKGGERGRRAQPGREAGKANGMQQHGMAKKWGEGQRLKRHSRNVATRRVHDGRCSIRRLDVLKAL